MGGAVPLSTRPTFQSEGDFGTDHLGLAWYEVHGRIEGLSYQAPASTAVPCPTRPVDSQSLLHP
jgi:hypothetical protein